MLRSLVGPGVLHRPRLSLRSPRIPPKNPKGWSPPLGVGLAHRRLLFAAPPAPQDALARLRRGSQEGRGSTALVPVTASTTRQRRPLPTGHLLYV